MSQSQTEGKHSAGRFRQFLRAAASSADRTFTIMLIPHSHKKKIAIRIHLYALILAAALISAVILTFFILAADFTASDSIETRMEQSRQSSQAELEQVIAEIRQVRQAAERFQASLDSASGTIGLEDEQQGTEGIDGDLSSIFGLQEIQEGDFRQLYDVQFLRSAVEQAIPRLERMYAAVEDQQDLLEEIPHLWPLPAGHGVITAVFGPGFSRMSDFWQVRHGVDIAVPSLGEPVLASANGVVTKIDFDPVDKGWYLVVQHRYGFSSQYSHLNRVFAGEGDHVSQGQVIAEAGSSGLVQSPQLGFQIMLGSDVLDPSVYIQNTSGQWTGSARSGT